MHAHILSTFVWISRNSFGNQSFNKKSQLSPSLSSFFWDTVYIYICVKRNLRASHSDHTTIWIILEMKSNEFSNFVAVSQLSQ